MQFVLLDAGDDLDTLERVLYPVLGHGHDLLQCRRLWSDVDLEVVCDEVDHVGDDDDDNNDDDDDDDDENNDSGDYGKRWWWQSWW